MIAPRRNTGANRSGKCVLELCWTFANTDGAFTDTVGGILDATNAIDFCRVLASCANSIASLDRSSPHWRSNI